MRAPDRLAPPARAVEGPQGHPRPQLAAAGTGTQRPGQGLFPWLGAVGSWARPRPPRAAPAPPAAALEVRLPPKGTLPAPGRR